MTAADDDPRPDLPRRLPSRQGSPNGSSTGRAGTAGRPHAGAGDARDDPVGPGVPGAADDSDDLEAVSKLMAFLQEHDTDS
jgi:hypothetical protein